MPAEKRDRRRQMRESPSNVSNNTESTTVSDERLIDIDSNNDTNSTTNTSYSGQSAFYLHFPRPENDADRPTYQRDQTDENAQENTRVKTAGDEGNTNVKTIVGNDSYEEPIVHLAPPRVVSNLPQSCQSRSISTRNEVRAGPNLRSRTNPARDQTVEELGSRLGQAVVRERHTTPDFCTINSQASEHIYDSAMSTTATNINDLKRQIKELKDSHDEMRRNYMSLKKSMKFTKLIAGCPCVLVVLIVFALGIVSVFIVTDRFFQVVPTESPASPTMAPHWTMDPMCSMCSEFEDEAQDYLRPRGDGICCLSGVHQIFYFIKQTANSILSEVKKDCVGQRTNGRTGNITACVQRPRPLIHISSQSMTHNTNASENYLLWKNEGNEYIIQGGLRLLHGKFIEIPETGYYFSYSKIHFKQQSGAKLGRFPLSHEIMLKRCCDTQDLRVASITQKCQFSGSLMEHTSVLQTTLHLKGGDELYLKANDWENVNKKEGEHSFGTLQNIVHRGPWTYHRDWDEIGAMRAVPSGCCVITNNIG